MKTISKDSKVPKRKHNANASTLRQVNTLLREVKIVEGYCDKNASKNGRNEKLLDKFDNDKDQYYDIMRQLKDDIKIYEKMEKKLGTSGESIRVKSDIKKGFVIAQNKYKVLEKDYENDIIKNRKKKVGAPSKEALEERKKLLVSLSHDLKYTENQFNTINKDDENFGGVYNLAKQARKRRQEKRQQNGNIESRPLSKQEQEFIQISEQKENALDETLDEILGITRKIRGIADDINIEMEKQELIIDELGDHMGEMTGKLEKGNKKMKDMLKNSGGAANWCCGIILVIILVALLGYIYNLAV